MKSTIKWKNIYYMLVYAIDELAYVKISDTDVEACKSLDDLHATLLVKSIELLYNNKFLSEYNRVKDEVDKLKGRVDIVRSYNKGILSKGKVLSDYYKLNINSIYNKVIKLAIRYLISIKHKISSSNTVYLLRVLNDFSKVDDITIYELDFNDMGIIGLPEWYKPAVTVSEMILRDLLVLDSTGKKRLYKLDDESRLKYIFEKFVRNFYTKEYRKVSVSKPAFKVEQLVGYRYNILDMMLESDDVVLIIDTKFYTSKNSYDSNKIINRREVSDYIQSYNEHNNIMGTEKKIYGVVLYAKPWKEYTIVASGEKRAGGRYTICDEIIDLNQDFNKIKNDLISLADKYIENKPIIE